MARDYTPESPILFLNLSVQTRRVAGEGVSNNTATRNLTIHPCFLISSAAAGILRH